MGKLRFFQTVQILLNLLLPGIISRVHVELYACTPGLTNGYVSHNGDISFEVEDLTQSFGIFQNVLGSGAELHQVVVPYLEQGSIMNRSDDEELVLVQYILGIEAGSCTHDLGHAKNGQVGAKALDRRVDTLSLSFSFLGLVSGVDVR